MRSVCTNSASLLHVIPFAFPLALPSLAINQSKPPVLILCTVICRTLLCCPACAQCSSVFDLGQAKSPTGALLPNNVHSVEAVTKFAFHDPCRPSLCCHPCEMGCGCGWNGMGWDVLPEACSLDSSLSTAFCFSPRPFSSFANALSADPAVVRRTLVHLVTRCASVHSSSS